MHVGASEVQDFRLGSAQVKSIYYQGQLVWPQFRLPGPLDSPATLAWWTADDPGSFTLGPGGTVVEWRDQIHGYPMAQGVALSRPTYSQNAFGGLPGVVFVAAQEQFLTFPEVHWPVDSDQSGFFMVVRPQTPPSDTNPKTLASYGGAEFRERKLQRRVFEGVNRAAAEQGNGFSSGFLLEPDVDFSGYHSAVAWFQDVSGTVGVDNSFGGVNTIALRTENAVRTRLGATSTGVPGEFADMTVRDFVIVNAEDLQEDDFVNLMLWGMDRRP